MERANSCKLCFSVFDGYCRPRSLPCGHSFCSTCIDKNIQDKRLTCPNCKITIAATNGKDFPINLALEEVLADYGNKYILEPVQHDIGERSRKMQGIIDEQKASTQNLITESEKIREQIKFYNDFLRERKAQHANDLQNLGVLTKQNQVIILQINEEMARLVEIGKEFEGFRGRVQEKLPSLDRAKSTQAAIAAIDDLDKSFSTLEKWCNLCQETLPNANIVADSGKILSVTKAALSVVSSLKNEGGPEVPDLSNTRLTVMEKLSRISQQTSLTVEQFRSQRDYYLELIKENKLYAVQFNGGKISSAKLTLSGNKICLHCLRDEEPPKNVETIKHSELVKTLDKSSTMVFVDLAMQGYTKGRVYILLSSDNPLTRQVRLLCSGELGPSYLNDKFSNETQTGKITSVTAGDYENHDGTGGNLIVEEFVPDASSYGNPNTEGMVYATHGLEDTKKGAQFSIVTRFLNVNSTFAFGTSTTPHHKIVLGYVKEGLDNLRNATYGNNCSNVAIADCGVVLTISY